MLNLLELEGKYVGFGYEKFFIRLVVNRVVVFVDVEWKIWVIMDSFRKYIFFL